MALVGFYTLRRDAFFGDRDALCRAANKRKARTVIFLSPAAAWKWGKGSCEVLDRLLVIRSRRVDRILVVYESRRTLGRRQDLYARGDRFSG